MKRIINFNMVEGNPSVIKANQVLVQFDTNSGTLKDVQMRGSSGDLQSILPASSVEYINIPSVFKVLPIKDTPEPFTSDMQEAYIILKSHVPQNASNTYCTIYQCLGYCSESEFGEILNVTYLENDRPTMLYFFPTESGDKMYIKKLVQ